MCGGGAQSDFWGRMIADVLGLSVHQPADKENGARGAYLFALYATGEAASIPEAVDRHVAFARTYLPDPDAARGYETAFRVWLRLREPAMRQWRVLREAR